MYWIVALVAFLGSFAFADWNGLISKPSSVERNGKTFYEITTPENLAWFAVQVNKGHVSYNAVLKNDISITTSSVTSETISWEPIGNDSTAETMFTGEFDGDGYTISGLYSNATYGGLFGVVGKGGIVKNLKMKNALVEAKGFRSGILANVFGGDSIINVSIEGEVFHKSLTGGFVGYMVGFNVVNQSVSKVKLRGEGSVACFAATVQSGEFVGNRSECVLDSAGNTANFAGFVGTVNKYALFKNDTNMTSVLRTGTNSGGSATSSGFVWKVDSDATVYFDNSLNLGSMKNSYNFGGSVAGFVGSVKGNVVFDNTVNKGDIVDSAEGVKDPAFYAAGFVADFSGNKAIFRNSTNEGNIYSSSYRSPKAAGFMAYISGSGNVMFEKCENGGNVDASGYYPNAAGFVAYFIGDSLKISNSKNTGTISRYNASGFVSYYKGSLLKIEQSENSGNIESSGTVGGLVSISLFHADDYLVEIHNSVNSGKIVANNAVRAGGIIGVGFGTLIENCENYGNIEDYSPAYNVVTGIGGISGGYGIIKNSTNYGNLIYGDSSLTGSVYMGGIAGKSDTVSVYGFLGVEKSENRGNLYVKGAKVAIVGGIFAYTLHLHNFIRCANHGRVEVENVAGSADVFGLGYVEYDISKFGGNLNTGRLRIVGEGNNRIASLLYFRGSSETIVSGSVSLTDSVSINEELTAGLQFRIGYLGDIYDKCTFFDKDVMPVDKDSLGWGVSTKDLQTEEFAWRLNTCNGRLPNSEIWSQKGNSYPVWSSDSLHPIYKLVFKDTAKVLIIYSYSVDSSFTNAEGKAIKIPDGPDPSDADEDLMFGYWMFKGNQKLTKDVVNTGDESVYATYVAKGTSISTVAFEAAGRVIESYAVTGGFSVIVLPEAPQWVGHNFIGWYNGTQLAGLPGVEVSVKTDTKFVAKYDVEMYKITFMQGVDTLQSLELPYGDIPEYSGKTPVSKVDGFVFVGWTPSVVPVTGIATYEATFGKSSYSSSSSPNSSRSQSAISSSSEGKTSVNYAWITNAKVRVENRKILLSGIESESLVALLDMQGRVVFKTRVSGGVLVVPEVYCGRYILRVNNRVQAITVK